MFHGTSLDASPQIAQRNLVFHNAKRPSGCLLVAGHQFRVPVSGAPGLCFSKCLGHVYIECACTEAFELRDIEGDEPFLNCELYEHTPSNSAVGVYIFTLTNIYIYI